nr:pyridoxamine 5'-phosphate oxidase family protein [Roseovarius confluentis]
MQFRGGPRGFLKMLDDQTLGYADYRGNRQYISTGNLADNDRISLILMDYPNSARLKILGRVRISDDPDLISRLMDEGYKARPERAVVITVEGFDWNCPQHIPVRLTMEELDPILAPFQQELADLRSENAALKARLDAAQSL